jgi:hypothetical protein
LLIGLEVSVHHSRDVRVKQSNSHYGSQETERGREKERERDRGREREREREREKAIMLAGFLLFLLLFYLGP